MTNTFSLRSVGIAALMTVCVAAFAQRAALPTAAQLEERGVVRVQDDALAALINNQTIEHTRAATGEVFTIYYRDDGRRFLTLAGRVRETKWWIKDGKRCEGSVATASTVCMKIFREAEFHRACVDGEITCNWLLTSFVPGDVDGLAK